jgi:hypothetical protein
LQGQGEKPFPCGTPPHKDVWLTHFQQFELPKMRLQQRSDTLIYVPLTIHLVGKDDGTGLFKETNFWDAFCRLNTDFDGTGIQFYVKDSIRHHYRSEWHDHETVLDGAYMMFEANVENTLNIYFVSNPARNCGYNLPYAGIAMNNGCSGPNDHTWAHEVGHAFSLPHPFLGWEGDVYNYSDTTPSRVTYDYTFFKDSLILDTTIIDTAWVEYVERKNCLIAGDGFCDTPPDFLSRRWTCNLTTGESQELQKDPDGVDFRSDATLFMSYATDQCSNRFSPDQIAAMNANIRQRKPYLIDQLPPPVHPSSEPVALLIPDNDGVANSGITYFAWEPIENVDRYIIQISRFDDFRFIQEEQFISTPEATIHGLRNNIKYYWRIRPVHKYFSCIPYSEVWSFTASEMVSTRTASNSNECYVFPNPVRQDGHIHVILGNSNNGNIVYIRWIDVRGNVIANDQHITTEGRSRLDIRVPYEANVHGLYFLNIYNGEISRTQKIYIKG